MKKRKVLYGILTALFLTTFSVPAMAQENMGNAPIISAEDHSSDPAIMEDGMHTEYLFTGTEVLSKIAGLIIKDPAIISVQMGMHTQAAIKLAKRFMFLIIRESFLRTAKISL